MSTRDLSHGTPSLFDVLPPAAVPEIVETAKEEKGTDQLARDFVRWCFSFGAAFRNSPDVNNLRYWAQKTKLKMKNGEEPEILAMARPLFFKRIEQITRKADTSN